jgi:glycosyltransferase involved in cell wall biosynthesis
MKRGPKRTMSGALRVTNWQRTLTEHQVHLWRAVSSQLHGRLTVYVAAYQIAERRRQGWAIPDFSGIDLRSLGQSSWQIIRQGTAAIFHERDSVHIFNTMWEDKRLFWVFLAGVCLGRRIGLVSEPYPEILISYHGNESGLKLRAKRLLRRACYAIAGGCFQSRVLFILAISPRACAQFARAGFRADSIFPFGYFIPSALKTIVNSSPQSLSLRVAYVGSFDPRKGVDRAVAAVGMLVDSGTAITLECFGPGSVPEFKQRGVTFSGPIGFGKVPQVIAGYDLLVVPSRFDGWSVVVNEAIFAAVPVIVADTVGSAAMVSQNGLGFEFDGSTDQLSAILRRCSEQPEILESIRERQRAFAGRLKPEVAAKYLIEVVQESLGNSEAGECPWYRLRQ